MEIKNLWDKLAQPSNSLESFKKDISEGKVPELPYYIIGQNELKNKVKNKIQDIDSNRMTTNLIVGEYGNGKTNLLKYLQLFFNITNKKLDIKVLYSRADIERTDLVLFLLKIVQDNYIEELVNIIKKVRIDVNSIPSLLNNYQDNFSEIKSYSESLFSLSNDDEKIIEILYLGTGRLYNKRYFDRYNLQQLKDFNRREILVLFLNLLAKDKKYIIFAIDEIEKIAEKSKIRFNHFLTSYRELVDLFNKINGHYLIVASTNITGPNFIDEANSALYTRIKNDIIEIEPLIKKDDLKELIRYLNELFDKNENVSDVLSVINKVGKRNNRILIQEISKILHRENIIKPLNLLLEDNNLMTEYIATQDKLNKDEAFKNIHRKFFDPLEYYIESIGISSNGLNKQEKILIDESTEKVHYFIFNSYLVDFENEKSKISKLINENPEKQIIIYSPEKLGLTNSVIEIDANIKIIDYLPEELFTILEMYRENFEFQPKLNDIISNYTRQNL